MVSGSTVFVLLLFQLIVGLVLGLFLADWLRGLVTRLRDLLDEVVERRLGHRSALPVEAFPPEVSPVAHEGPAPALEPQETAQQASRPEGGIDQETRLPDRQAFEYALFREITLARRRGHPLCVVLCEADQFSRVCDEQGDIVGAEVMQSIANLVLAELSDETFVSRFDHARLAVILTGYDREAASTVAEGLHKAVAASRFGDDVNGQIEATLSVALAELGPNDDVDSLTTRADVAVQAACEAGGGRAYVHDGKGCEPIAETLGSATR